MTRPHSPEHRAKISAALQRYAARPDSHLHELHRAGEEHPHWRGGVKPEYYRKVGFDAHGRTCACGAPATMVHHKDRNRRNSNPGNLEPMCRPCHQRLHHGKRVAWTCPVCGTTLELVPYIATRRRFCSRSCKEASRGEDGRYGR